MNFRRFLLGISDILAHSALLWVSEETREGHKITPHIRRRGEQPLVGCTMGKPRRWVVERTNSWHNRYRDLLVRWERNASNYLAMLQLACGLIAYQQA